MASLRTCIVLLALLATAARLRAEPFVRIAGNYAVYQRDGFSNRAGLSLAAGTSLGADNNHELGLETGSLDWGYKESFEVPRDVFGAVSGERGDGRLIPVLLTYRYCFGRAATPLRFHIEAVAGYTRSSGSWLEINGSLGPLYNQPVPFAAWRPTVGAGLGAEWAVGSRLSIDFGYRWITIGGGTTPPTLVRYFYNQATFGETTLSRTIPSMQMSLLTVGLHYRF
ncbi:MAG: hypothetical protein IPL39_21025 [Opitutaceae bacterium]|nr:hypothetical protein [Opitutaceae bacterium]